jgi:AcrR family transcriptional regulator
MGITERRHREKEKRLQFILDNAEELLKSEGFNNFTLSKLAEKIEFSRGIIYYYFKNEQNIIAKIIVDKMLKLIDRINNIPEQENGFKQIREIIDEFLLFLIDEPHYLNLITYFLAGKEVNGKKDYGQYFKEYEVMRDTIFLKCLDAVKNGIKDGSIYPEIDAHTMTYCIWACIGSFWQYMMKDNLLKPGQNPLNDKPDIYIKAFFEIFYRGLKNDKPGQV